MSSHHTFAAAWNFFSVAATRTVNSFLTSSISSSSSLNASSINIRPTVGSQFENSFKPYFGKKTKTLQTIPSEYKGSQRTQFGVQRGCPTSTNTSYGYTDVFGNVYIGDGTVAIKVSNEDKDFIKISQSVSLNDVIDQNIHVLGYSWQVCQTKRFY